MGLWDQPAQLVLLARPEQWDLPDLPVLPEQLGLLVQWDLPAQLVLLVQRDLPVLPELPEQLGLPDLLVLPELLELLGLLELLPPGLPSQIFLPTVTSTL